MPARHFASLKAFLQQVARLAPLDRPGTVAPRLRDHLVRTAIVARGDEVEMEFYAELFRRYCREWHDLAGMGRELGWPWAEMLAPRQVAV